MFYVYRLLNPLKKNQPFYIGKGKDRRAYRHFQAIEWKESKSNPHKTRTLRLIKEAGLEPGIDIIPCITEQKAFKLEKQLIEKYGRSKDGGILTNICFGGEGNSSGQRRVRQYNVYGELINVHLSLLDAAYSVGVKNSSSIVSACKRKEGDVRTPYGFVWCYDGEEPDWGWVFKKKRPVYQYTLDGKFINRYMNANQAAKMNGFSSNRSEIAKCCQDKIIQCKGYKWSYNKKET